MCRKLLRCFASCVLSSAGLNFVAFKLFRGCVAQFQAGVLIELRLQVMPTECFDFSCSCWLAQNGSSPVFWQCLFCFAGRIFLLLFCRRSPLIGCSKSHDIAVAASKTILPKRRRKMTRPAERAQLRPWLSSIDPTGQCANNFCLFALSSSRLPTPGALFFLHGPFMRARACVVCVR